MTIDAHIHVFPDYTAEQHLASHEADMVIMGEREIARRMIESAIDRNERLQQS